jgi:hypothetical protein
LNGKLIAIVLVCLLIGIGVGFGIGFSVKIQSFFVDYGALNTRYNQLKTDYDNLNATYYQLNTTYNELQANYSRLDAVKGFVFDKTINVTAEIEEHSWYDTFKGNVTNIGNVTIPKIYIFIFFYKPDGSLSTYNSETIENLYPNETNSFYFDVYYEDYTFKIFAVGNY